MMIWRALFLNCQKLAILLFCYYNNNNSRSTVTPVLRSHIGTMKKWPYKTGHILKKIKFIWNFLWQDNIKKVTFFKTGNCLIEVSTWAGLTVFLLWSNVIVSLIIGQGHRHFLCESSMELEREFMVLHHAKIVQGMYECFSSLNVPNIAISLGLNSVKNLLI